MAHAATKNSSGILYMDKEFDSYYFWHVSRTLKRRWDSDVRDPELNVDIVIAFRLSDSQRFDPNDPKWNVEICIDRCYFKDGIPNILKKYAYAVFFKSFNGGAATCTIGGMGRANSSERLFLEESFFEKALGKRRGKALGVSRAVYDLLNMSTKLEEFLASLSFKCPLSSRAINEILSAQRVKYEKRFKNWLDRMTLFAENVDETADLGGDLPTMTGAYLRQNLEVFAKPGGVFTKIAWGEFFLGEAKIKKELTFFLAIAYGGNIIHTVTEIVPHKIASFSVVFGDLSCRGDILKTTDGLLEFFYFIILSTLRGVGDTTKNAYIIAGNAGISFDYYGCTREEKDPYSGKDVFGDLLSFSKNVAEEYNRRVERDQLRSIPKLVLGFRMWEEGEDEMAAKIARKIRRADGGFDKKFIERFKRMSINPDEGLVRCKSDYQFFVHDTGGVARSMSTFMTQMVEETKSRNGSNPPPRTDSIATPFADEYEYETPDNFERNVRTISALTVCIKNKEDDIVSAAVFKLIKPEETNFTKPFLVTQTVEGHRNVLEISSMYTLKQHRNKGLIEAILTLVLSVCWIGEEYGVGWMVCRTKNTMERLLTTNFGFHVLQDETGFLYGRYAAGAEIFKKWELKPLPLVWRLKDVYLGQPQRKNFETVFGRKDVRWNLGVSTQDGAFADILVGQMKRLHKCGFEFLQQSRKRKNSGPLESGKKQRTECQVCGVLVGEIFSCGGCGDTMYCGQQCQKRHWALHSKICAAIN